MNICKTCNLEAKCPETFLLHEQCEDCVEAHHDNIDTVSNTATVSVQNDGIVWGDDTKLYHGHGDDDAVS